MEKMDTREFREEAVKLVTEKSISLPEAARPAVLASITVVIEADRRQFKILQNISRSSIIGNADRQDLGSYHLWPMNKDYMQDY